MDEIFTELIKDLGYPLGTILFIGLFFFIWRQFFEKSVDSIFSKNLQVLEHQNSVALEVLSKDLDIINEQRKKALELEAWPIDLARELQKIRGVERQNLRFKSYGTLWEKLRPLAVYDDNSINKQAVGTLSTNLSNWYFSEYGGLLLTPQSREFYFALQDLLRIISRSSDDWDIERNEESVGTQADRFLKVLEKVKANKATTIMNYFKAKDFKDWEAIAAEHGKYWREDIKLVAEGWNDLTVEERFAALQQVGSKLRSSLVNDLESRLI